MIDTNLIIGRLGSGKTTCIKQLISNIPKNEYWAIIINEFGQVGIDSALLTPPNKNDLNITEINGGCICCAAQSQLRVSLTNLIRRQKPDRIIIEATGLGHPAGIIDLLRDEFLKPYINIASIITVIDLTLFKNSYDAQDSKSPISTESFSHQTELADIIILNKSDLVNDNAIENAKVYLNGIYPSKREIILTSQAKLDINHLSPPSDIHLKQQLHQHTDKHYVSNKESIKHLGHEIQIFTSKNTDNMSLGFIFSSDVEFIRNKLQPLFNQWLSKKHSKIIRLKAVFNCGRFWQSFNALETDLKIEESYYRRDSRIELVIDDCEFDIKHFKNELIACIKQ